jgi:hypothetical protein
MPVTKEQAQNLLNKGYSEDEVVQFMKRTGTQDTGISNQDIAQHPVKSLVKTFMQPAAQSLTGKTLEQSMPYIHTPQENTPMGRVQAIGVNTMADVGAKMADIATTPSTYALAPVLKYLGIPIMGAINKGIVKPIQEGIAASKELKQTAQTVGSASSKSGSITRAISEGTDKLVKPLKESLDSEKSNFSDIKESLQKEISNKKELNTSKLKMTKEGQDARRELVMSDLEQQKQSLTEALQGEAEDITKYMKDEIPNKVKSMNDVFGQHLDEIGSEMEKSGKGISQLDRYGILKRTLDEANDLGITTGRARGLLEKLHADAAKAVEGETVNTGIIDVTGKPIISKTLSKGQELIPFRDFINETREFRRILSESKLSGVKGMNDEDIVGAMYYKNLDKYMESNVNGYKALQKDYAPVINAMKASRRIFKPGDTYSDEQGVNLIKKYAMGKTTAGKEQLLGDIQKESRFGKGVGDVTSKAKSIGDKLSTVTDTVKKMPKTLQKKFDAELEDIRSTHEKEIGDLEKRLEEAKGKSQMKADTIKDQIDDINHLSDMRISHVKNVADRLEEIKAKGKVLSVLGALGVEGIGRKGKDVKHLLFN